MVSGKRDQGVPRGRGRPPYKFFTASHRRGSVAGNALGYNAESLPQFVPGAAISVAAAAQALPFGVATTDIHGIITWANPAYSQLRGAGCEELIGQSAGDFAWKALANSAASTAPRLEDAVFERTPGETARVAHSITPLRAADGSVTGFWIMAQEGAASPGPNDGPHEETQLHSIANTVPGVVFEFYARDNGERGLSYLSDRWLQVTGMEREPMATAFQRFIEHLHPDDRDQFIDCVENAVREVAKCEFAGRLLKPSGEETIVKGMSEGVRRQGEVIFAGIFST